MPGATNQFVNSAAVWSLAPFAAGALLPHRRRAAVAAATAAVCGEVVGYYAYAELARGGMGALHYTLLWLVVALVAGPVFGTAGAWWREGPGRRATAGGAVLGGVFGGEGMHYLLVLGHATEGVLFLVATLLVPLLLGRDTRERVRGLLALLPATALLYAFGLAQDLVMT
ncbi:hypothetical protein K6I34_004157 [Streptomyces sp. UNOC14_S4]|nr:hypothetical protein [Streptomyces sp. UNOC14_S4]